jgi:hypothetical protein
MPPKQEANQALRAIVREFGALESDTAARALVYLREMRDRLQLQLTGTETVRAWQLRELLAGVDRLIAEYEVRLIGLANGALRNGAQLGALSVTGPLSAAGLGIGFFQPSPAQLEVMLDFSADLVRGVTAELRRMINTQIRLAVLGEKSSVSAMQEINARLGIPARGNNVTEGIAYRGERIVRTEMGRAYNLANHNQLQATAQVEPELRKSWIATGDRRTRASHLRAHMDYAEKPIPVSEPFIVGGAELMYPLDPAGPPEQTIACRCRMVAVHPSIGRIGGPEDARIRKELERREE